MFTEKVITPFKGTETFEFYKTLDEIKTYFSSNKISFREEYWSSESETIPNPWNVIIIDDVISLFFAKNKKLFKIVFWENYFGNLPNGIHTGMKIEDAIIHDKSLFYDEWNEVYVSDNGYWIEDNIETNQVMSISIYIKELLDDELFDSCKW